MTRSSSAQLRCLRTRRRALRRLSLRRLLITALAVVIIAAVSMPSAVAANAGDLDTSFGSSGLVRQDIFGGVNDDANAMAIQPNGKIVVAGSWHNFRSVTDYSGRTFAIARFNRDGSLDESFGSAGRTVTAFANGPAVAEGVAVQGNSKIVVAGWHDDDRSEIGPKFALARYDRDGQLDESFSGDGKVRTTFGGWDQAKAVAIRDGRIIAAGHSNNGDDFALARYRPDGSLDDSFSGDGKLTTGFDGDETANAVAITALGKIVAAGSKYTCDCGIFGSGPNLDFALARYNTDGSLDDDGNQDFDDDGKVVTGFGSHEAATAVAMQPNGWIVAAGAKDQHFALARYDPRGALDEHFDKDGKVVTDVFGSHASAEALAIQSDGKIVAAGSSYEYSPTKYDFVLTRYRRDGTLDKSFSVDGEVRTGLSGRYDNSRAVAIQGDGKIVAAGTLGWLGDGGDFGLARYHAE